MNTAFQLKFNSKIKYNGEVGVTVFTENLDSKISDSLTTANYVSFLIKPRSSTFTDYAGLSSIQYNEKNFKLGLNAQYIGAGFKSPGFPNRPSDLIDLTININTNLLKKKISLSTITGLRKDNLSMTKVTSNSSLLINASLGIQVFKFLVINSSYMNFGVERKEINDSLNLSTISENLTISPTINFNTKSYFHTINLSFAKNSSENINFLSGLNAFNEILSFNVLYQVRINRFNVSLNGFTSNNRQNNITLNIKSINILPNILLLNKKLKLGIGIAYTISDSPIRIDSRKSLQIRSNYSFSKTFDFSLKSNINNIKMRSNSQLTEFGEFRMQVGLSYKFGIARSNNHKLKKDKLVGNKDITQHGKNKVTSTLNEIDSILNTDHKVEKKEMINYSKVQNSILVNSTNKVDSIRDFNKVNLDSLHSKEIFRIDIKETLEVAPIKIENLDNSKNVLGHDLKKEKEKTYYKDSINSNEDSKEETYYISYFIQIGATKYKVDLGKNYGRINETIVVKTENGFFKYLVDSGKSINVARSKLEDLKKLGYKDCFIVKYKNGIRVNIND